MPTTYNPLDKAQMDLSNGNLTATNNITSGQGFVRSTTSKSSGFLYWEVHVDSFAGGFHLPGLAIAAYDYTDNVPGFDFGFNSMGLAMGGGAGVQIWCARSNLGAVGGGGYSAHVGDTIANVYKVATNEYWGRIWATWTGPGWINDWNATPGADPATGTGGIVLTGLNAGARFIVVGGQNTGDQVTLNPGPTGFLAAMPPTGVTAWEAGVAQEAEIFIAV